MATAEERKEGKAIIENIMRRAERLLASSMNVSAKAVPLAPATTYDMNCAAAHAGEAAGLFRRCARIAERLSV